jgi:long-chain acyl-CoA synthetase
MPDNLDVLHKKLEIIASQFPDKTAIQTKNNKEYTAYTYKEVYHKSCVIARFLINCGIKKGDRIVIVLDNRPEWASIYFAILLAGCIAVPVDFQVGIEELDFIIKETESKTVFTSTKYLALFSSSLLNQIVVLDYEPGFQNKLQTKLIDFLEILSGTEEVLNFPEVSIHDIASILYTSGTTGRPKGVMLTHANLYSNFLSIDKLKICSHKDNILSILPLHHSFSLMVTLIIPLFTPCKITYYPDLRLEQLRECMNETGVTILVIVPQILDLLYKHILNEVNKIPFPGRIIFKELMELLSIIRKFSGLNVNKLVLANVHKKFGKKLRFFGVGGAKMNEDSAEFISRMGFTILEGYGLTETSPIVTFNPLRKQKIGSVGTVIPGVELRILNPDEKGVGEALIKGPNIMKGYYKNEEATREVLKEEWFYSGDLGYLDKEGYLYLYGRRKSLIVLSSGKNISYEEVESYYSKSLFIKELCVLAVGKMGEEKLMAVIVPDVEHFLKMREVNIYWKIKWDLENLTRQYSAYKRIMGFIVTKYPLPRTSLGELKRFEVQEKYMDELIGKAGRLLEKKEISKEDKQILSTETSKQIIEILNKQIKTGKTIQLEDHLELDLGIDSLGRVELMVEMEKAFNVDIADSMMAKVFTVKELVGMVRKLSTKEIISEKKKPLPKSLLWHDILQKKPAENITETIDISPGLVSRIFTLIFGTLFHILLKLVWRIKIVGKKELPLRENFILCPNHSSFMDGFVIAASVPVNLKRKMFFLGFRDYFKVPIIRNIIKLIRIIPIDSATHLIDAMQACAYVLNNGKSMCIFPEGARTIDGEIKEFKKGIGILAKELNVRLVPVYIKGTYGAWSRTVRFPKSFSISVIFGKPQDTNELIIKGIELGAVDDYDAVAIGIKEEVVKLSNRVK